MSSLTYFRNDSLAASVWHSKYAKKGENTPDDMHRRLAIEFARKKCELNPELVFKDEFELILSLISNFKYIVPQGSVMSQLGSDSIGSLSNCFVVGQPSDSYGGIFEKDQQLAQLMKRRGGVGIDISTLRPNGVATTNAANSSTGAVSFMERYSNTTREVAQNGRRGALMISIDCRHPDIRSFLSVKSDLTKVTGANISVQFRDDFMKAAGDNTDYYLRFPCDAEINVKQELPYNELITLECGTLIKRVNAREIWEEFSEYAHRMAEPGAMYKDRHFDYSPDTVYALYKGVTTNPCGEIFMSAYDACRLILLNLLSFVENAYKDSAYINYSLLSNYAYEIQILGDLIVDLELEHIDKILNKVISDPESEKTKQAEIDLWTNIKHVTSSGRRTGCGITALGDMLAALGFKYDSKEALAESDKVMKTIFRAQLTASIDLAEKFGPFQGWDASKEYSINKDGSYTGKNDFYQMIWDEFPDLVKRMYISGRRNVSWSTVNGGFIK